MNRTMLTAAWDRIIDLMFGAGALYLVLIVFATIWEVLGRNLGIYAPIWLSTFTEFGMLISAMLAAPRLVRDRGHVSMELIDSLLPTSMKAAVVRMTDCIAGAVSFIVLWYCANAGVSAYVRNEVDVLTVNVPRWILFAVLCMGFLFCGIEFVRHIFKPNNVRKQAQPGEAL